MQGQVRTNWGQHYQNTNGLIYVVDTNDKMRIDEAATELQKVLKEEGLQDVALLVLANKSDMPDFLSAAEIANTLGLHSLAPRQWYIQPTSVSGEGLFEAADWLSRVLNK